MNSYSTKRVKVKYYFSHIYKGISAAEWFERMTRNLKVVELYHSIRECNFLEMLGVQPESREWVLESSLCVKWRNDTVATEFVQTTTSAYSF